jgi:ABC-type uncharacterized transport system auxiliary subunit
MTVKTRWINIFIMVALSGTLIGCAGKIKYPTYYTLQVPPISDPPQQDRAAASIAVREFRSATYLREGPIVYRPSPEQIGFYEYHRWAVDPREVVTNAIADRLRGDGRFTDVKIYDGHSNSDYILTGRLEKLDEVDYEKGVKVEVALSAQLIEVRTGKTTWVNSVSDSSRVDERSVPTVVAEMSHTMDRAIQKLLSSLPAPATVARN